VARCVSRAEECEGIGINLAPDERDDELETAIALLEQGLVPAGRPMASEAVGICCEVLQCRKPSAMASEVYTSLLGELPADLLQQAVHDGLSRATHHFLPTPGFFIGCVAEAWRWRKTRLDLLRRHLARVRLFRRRR
jgi:hypothetical protein